MKKFRELERKRERKKERCWISEDDSCLAPMFIFVEWKNAKDYFKNFLDEKMNVESKSIFCESARIYLVTIMMSKMSKIRSYCLFVFRRNLFKKGLGPSAKIVLKKL